MGNARNLGKIWLYVADTSCRGYSPIYERICRTVADSDEVLDLVCEAPPVAHNPVLLLAAVHYLLLGGLDHPLAAVYAGESEADPGPLFVDVCLENRDVILELLVTQQVNTNEVGRSAAIGPALTVAASRLRVPSVWSTSAAVRGSTCSATATASTTDRRARPGLLTCQCRSVARSSMGRRRSRPRFLRSLHAWASTARRSTCTIPTNRDGSWRVRGPTRDHSRNEARPRGGPARVAHRDPRRCRRRRRRGDREPSARRECRGDDHMGGRILLARAASGVSTCGR